MSDYDDDMMYDSEAEDMDEPEDDDLEVQTENKYFEAKGTQNHLVCVFISLCGLNSFVFSTCRYRR